MSLLGGVGLSSKLSDCWKNFSFLYRNIKNLITQKPPANPWQVISFHFASLKATRLCFCHFNARWPQQLIRSGPPRTLSHFIRLTASIPSPLRSHMPTPAKWLLFSTRQLASSKATGLRFHCFKWFGSRHLIRAGPPGITSHFISLTVQMIDCNFNCRIPSAVQYHPGSDSVSYSRSPSCSTGVKFTYLVFITPQQRIKATGPWERCFCVSGEHSMEGYFAEKCKRTFFDYFPDYCNLLWVLLVPKKWVSHVLIPFAWLLAVSKFNRSPGIYFCLENPMDGGAW